MNGTKNALFFLSQAPTHHSFTFNLRFLFELKHKVGLSRSTRFVSLKLSVGISIFDSFPFLFKFIFLYNKMHELFDFKTP